MATVEENITTVFKNVRLKQGFLEAFQTGQSAIPGSSVVLDLSPEDKQVLRDRAIELCDESIAALNEIRTAAGGE
jgi:hypothetical protein